MKGSLLMAEKKKKTAANPLKDHGYNFPDGHQSSLATRMRTEDMIPVAEAMDKIGWFAWKSFRPEHGRGVRAYGRPYSRLHRQPACLACGLS